MAFLQSSVFGVILTIFLAVLLGKILSTIAKYIVRAGAKRRDIEPAELPLGRIEWMIATIIILAGIHIALPMIAFADTAFLESVLMTLIVISLTILIIAAIDVSIHIFLKSVVKGTKSTADDQILYLAHKSSHIAIYVLAILYVLAVWGVQIMPLLASLGIAGLAVALALQPTLANIFSGISLVIDQTFSLGDIIKLETGEVGTVHHIGLRTTRIRTFDNEIIIIPNNNLANSMLQNYLQPDPSIRVNINFGVEYGTDPEYVKLFVIEELRQIPNMDEEKDVQVWFTSMGDNALSFTARFWMPDISQKWAAQQEGMTRIYRRLYQEGIGIPFPQRTIWVNEEGKASPPNPFDKKFKSVQGKLYPKFGHPMEEDATPEVAKKARKKRKKATRSAKGR
ncbi:MAG: mechanosensitive ion channel family protein [Nanoarchaeota archaeon]